MNMDLWTLDQRFHKVKLNSFSIFICMHVLIIALVWCFVYVRVFLVCPDLSATNLSSGKFILKSKKKDIFSRNLSCPGTNLHRTNLSPANQDKSGTLCSITILLLVSESYLMQLFVPNNFRSWHEAAFARKRVRGAINKKIIHKIKKSAKKLVYFCKNRHLHILMMQTGRYFCPRIFVVWSFLLIAPRILSLAKAASCHDLKLWGRKRDIK